MKKLLTPTALMLFPMIVLGGLDNRTKVISRLEAVGYSKAEGIARVDKMTDDEIGYLAEHPEAIKRSGFIVLASLIGSSVWTTINNKKQKKNAEEQRLRDEKASAERQEIIKKLGRR